MSFFIPIPNYYFLMFIQKLALSSFISFHGNSGWNFPLFIKVVFGDESSPHFSLHSHFWIPLYFSPFNHFSVVRFKELIKGFHTVWFLKELGIKSFHELIRSDKPYFTMGIIVYVDFDLIRREIFFDFGYWEEVDSIEKEGSGTNVGNIDGGGILVSSFDIEVIWWKSIVLEVPEDAFPQDDIFFLLAPFHVFLHSIVVHLPFLFFLTLFVPRISSLPLAPWLSSFHDLPSQFVNYTKITILSEYCYMFQSCVCSNIYFKYEYLRNWGRGKGERQILSRYWFFIYIFILF